MGVDKPNIRFVHHFDISETLDSYYQEIGRAGRDREPATACLFYRAEDLGLRRFQATPAAVSQGDVLRVIRVLRRTVGPIARPELARGARLSQRRLEAVVQPLEDMNLLGMTPAGEVQGLGARDEQEEPDWLAAATEVIARHDRRQRIEQSRVTMVRGYAELQTCRREYLLNYRGEVFHAPCGACDNDISGRTAAATTAATASAVAQNGTGSASLNFTLEDAVRHTRWGTGRIVRVEADRIVVLFDDVGYRTLATAAVVEQGLLTRVA
jgi:ATP-dependent DNA helicase RecQ